MTNNPKALLENWIRAFQHHDVAALVACYHEDGVNFQVAAGEPAVGINQISADFAAFFSAFPDSYSEVENIIADGDWAAWEWNGGGTFLGEFMGFQPNGRTYQLRGCGFFHFRDGKITLQRGYWDKLTWFAQIGIEA